jgi:hypothetical protein
LTRASKTISRHATGNAVRRERLNDADEFEDYRQRPPCETVAKLCAVFGLDLISASKPPTKPG